jgi:import inner membrane translocase subunit TIM21
VSSLSRSKTVLSKAQQNVFASFRLNKNLCPNNLAWRTLSSDAGSGEKKAGGGGGEDNKKAGAEDGSEETQIVLTPGQKVVAYSRLGMWAGIFVFACVCGYYILGELFPTKMSPNRVFNAALDVVKNNYEVKRRYGDKIKGYGRDHGGHREGRRNFVE